MAASGKKRKYTAAEQAYRAANPAPSSATSATKALPPALKQEHLKKIDQYLAAGNTAGAERFAKTVGGATDAEFKQYAAAKAPTVGAIASPQTAVSQVAPTALGQAPARDSRLDTVDQMLRAGNVQGAYDYGRQQGQSEPMIDAYFTQFAKANPTVRDPRLGVADAKMRAGDTAGVQAYGKQHGQTDAEIAAYMSQIGGGQQPTTPGQGGGLGQPPREPVRQWPSSLPTITTMQQRRDQNLADVNQPNSMSGLGNLLGDLRNRYATGAQTPALGGVTSAYQRDVKPMANQPTTWGMQPQQQFQSPLNAGGYPATQAGLMPAGYPINNMSPRPETGSPIDRSLQNTSGNTGPVTFGDNWSLRS